jgi:hypothetical protein
LIERKICELIASREPLYNCTIGDYWYILSKLPSIPFNRKNRSAE